MKKLNLPILILILILIVSCQKNIESCEELTEKEVVEETEEVAEEESQEIDEKEFEAKQKPKQLLIKTASISIEVDDYKEAKEKIEKLIKSKNAYISLLREDNNYGEISCFLKIRVANKN